MQEPAATGISAPLPGATDSYSIKGPQDSCKDFMPERGKVPPMAPCIFLVWRTLNLKQNFIKEGFC